MRVRWGLRLNWASMIVSAPFTITPTSTAAALWEKLELPRRFGATSTTDGILDYESGEDETPHH